MKSIVPTNIPLVDFCRKIKTDEDINVLKLVDLSLKNFVKASQEEIRNNPHDVENGVIEVYVAARLKVFGIFDSCVHKIYENGNKQFFFYTTIDNENLVEGVSTILYTELGTGLYDDRVFYSFRDKDKIQNIAHGQTHLFFYTPNNLLNIDQIRQIADILTEIYGEESSGSGKLQIYEERNINNFGTWLGRTYWFNEEHRLMGKDEICMYSVNTEYTDFNDDRLTLSIIDFNKLVTYMKYQIF